MDLILKLVQDGINNYVSLVTTFFILVAITGLFCGYTIIFLGGRGYSTDLIDGLTLCTMWSFAICFMQVITIAVSPSSISKGVLIFTIELAYLILVASIVSAGLSYISYFIDKRKVAKRVV